jgi:prepilin-type N-terminal cleavage/methylation domain-containing protein
MKRIQNNKRGFTLVEMMLALAIIVIIGWTTVALMIATRDSFMTTYNTNDSSDYAVLYANGVENTYLKHTQDRSATSITIDKDHSIMKDNGAAVFTPQQMKTRNVNTGNEVDKWQIRVYYSFDSTDGTQMVKYKVFVVDNYYSPDYKVMCIHEDSVWAPHMGYGKVSLANTLASDPVDTFLRSKAEYGLSGWKDTLKYNP